MNKRIYNMNKRQIQKRVLQNGKPLALDKFTWDAKSKTFSSNENNLVLDFKDMTGYNFTTGSYCTFKTSYGCNFTTGSYCTFDTGSYCTFKTSYGCNFTTGNDCTFDTGNGSTFDTGSNCNFITGNDCTFDTGSYCNFITGNGSTFNTGIMCIITRKDNFVVIQPKNRQLIQLKPHGINGYLYKDKDNKYYKDNKTHKDSIIVDGILSEIISHKGNVYKVKKYNSIKESFIVTNGNGLYAHGDTIKEARESLLYKISDRDTSEYESLSESDKMSLEDAIVMYRKITGSCESETKGFVDNLGDKRKSEYTIKEIIELTTGQYGNNTLKEFISKKLTI